MFFNFLPNCVASDRRYGPGTEEQKSAGRERFLGILRKQKPHKVLVFTSKWKVFPGTDEEEEERRLVPLAGFSNFKWGTYKFGAHTVTAFFLQHPQRAKTDTMRRAVKRILARPV